MKLILLLIVSCTITNFCMPQNSPAVKNFSVSQLLEKHAANQKRWYQFLDEETMFAGIYRLKAGDKDPQGPHNEDEIYYVLEGTAKLKAGDTTIIASPGAVIYVKEMVSHYFFDITSDITVLVLFSKAKASSADAERKVYSLSDAQLKRNDKKNMWIPFHRCATMDFGIYMLPKTLNGDTIVNHHWDELNIVTKGSGKFTIDNSTIDVKEGDIIYVSKGKGHYFHHLQSDFDVLILFEKKSIQ